MSVVSDASSSRGSVDTDALPPSRSSTSASVSSLPHSHSHSHTHSHTLSTKERRRERNRLAAQKHRLRRNERMSQLEQQVLALQHEKSQLLQRVDVVKSSVGDEKMRDVDEEEMPRAKPPRSASPDPQHPHVHPHALHPNSPPPHYTPTTNSHANGHGHGHGHSTAAPGYASTIAVAAAIADPDTLRRMEDRILELERWSEDLNGDLADALDSSARLTTDLHRACAASDAHARRAADVERTLKAERARHASQVADLMEAVDAQLSAAKMFKGANARMRESVEAAEETLGVLRAENGRLRARLAVVEANGGAGGDDDHLATIARLQDDLRETRAELEGARGDARRQRKLLREQESQEANAAEQRQRTKAREEAERRHAETALAALTARAEVAEQAAAKQQREVENARRAREESEAARRALEGSLEKIGSFLRTKGIAVTSEDERDEDGGGGGDGGYGYGVGR